MILVIDIGNTNLVFGYWDRRKWKAVWREETSVERPTMDYARSFRMQLLEHNLRFADIEHVAIGSVVPPLTEPISQMVLQTLELTPIVMKPSLYGQLPIRVHNTAEIGADLVANALAAYQRYQQAVLIVDFGTALTFTTVASSGSIQGVAIAPGLKTAMRSLAGNTAQLPEVPLSVPASVLGKDTAHAMQAGILSGYIGLVTHLIEQVKNELNEPLKVIATGGLSGILTPLHPLFDALDPLLTIEGLRLAVLAHANL